MKYGKLLSFCLLSLFVASAVVPFAAARVDYVPIPLSEARIYRQTIIDINGDKIEDRLTRDLETNEDNFIDVVVLYDHVITSYDKLKLASLGVSYSDDTWDLGRRILVTTSRDHLELLTSIPEVTLVSKGDIRYIMVAIEGDDFSDLAPLAQFEGSEIFWYVGCAMVRYYTGIENDINLLGTYTAIGDVTDVRLTVDTIPITDYVLDPNTQYTAQVINATSLWSLGYDGAGVKIGNIDTGVRDTHVDFSGRVIDAQSFISTTYGYDYNDPTTDDYNGHGTHTSGIMIGDGTQVANNIGIAPAADLYFAKIDSPATLVSMVAALNWLVGPKNVDCVNLSFGGGDQVGQDITEIAFANAVRSQNVLAAISAGNEGADGFYTVGSPGTCDDIISVGNLDQTSNPYSIAYSSSRALSADEHMKPDVMAPGTAITSCAHTSDTGYATYGGTSMAAPHVTAAIALLIDACQGTGTTYNAGLLKAALMQTANVMNFNLMYQGRGYINVGAAWNLISKATKDSGVAIIGACNPIQQPLSLWYDLLQGQVTEQFLTCVSPFKTDLTLTVTGSASPFVTVGNYLGQWTSPVKITYSIPVNTTTGIYTGQIEYAYKGTVIDTVDIELNVLASNGHRMLLNFNTTDYSIDHMYGQYARYTADILDNGFVISEQRAMLDSGILDNYEAVWLPDPFNYDFPNNVYDNYSYVITYNPLTAGEEAALHNYIQNGGTVFMCFLGHTQATIDGYGTIITNTNVTAVNEFTEPYGISVSDAVWTNPSPYIVNTLQNHALSAGVVGIDHYGCSLTLSGNATAITEVAPGSALATCAVVQMESGGRLIVLGTNFALDTEGYQNKYNFGGTQNDVFGMNLIRWATAEHRIMRIFENVTADGTVTLRYKYLSGPGADFGGYVILPDESPMELDWTEDSPGIWSTTFECTVDGVYEFYPECGATGVDDFDYFYYEIEASSTPVNGIAPIAIILISAFGLAGYVLFQRKRR